MIEKIVSGGQTGVDQTALRWAIENDVPHGGWCPKDRIAENGRIPDAFDLVETPRTAYKQRTRWNVRDSDATVLLTTEPELKTGTLNTSGIARNLEKPWIHLYPPLPINPDDPESFVLEAMMAGKELTAFVAMHNVKTLNVAGPRESNDPGAISWTHAVLSAAFAK